MSAIDEYLRARDLLLEQRADYAAAKAGFRWPRPERFNWAHDYFDAVPPRDGEALRVLHDDGSVERYSFEQLSQRSNQVAHYLHELGLQRGDAVLVSLGNVAPLWETMLAAIKLGLVVIPASTLLTAADLADRIARGKVRAVVAASELAERFAAAPASVARVAVGDAVDGWQLYTDSAACSTAPVAHPETAGDETLLLYFTSGTTSAPKLVEHTHSSYPVGHLSTMYAVGLQPGDVHLNISSPGWAKHAWSCLFAPWIAPATVVAHNTARFDAAALFDLLTRHEVTTLCAPPTVWRALVQQDLAAHKVALREALSAGEPLNPEIIECVQRDWAVTIRDFYGQTETTALVGNTPGQPIRPGSMGRALPGYDIALLDPDGKPGSDGEICVALGDARPVGLMTGYRDDADKTAAVMQGGHYRTGDAATIDADGYITYVGRIDDVFKASGYRISPFELESMLIEHAAVAEAAVVPSPDPKRGTVPKAFVVVAGGCKPDRDTAASILAHCREQLAPYKRVRRIEFAELPKTISGKIRRVELRAAEADRGDAPERRPGEYREEDFQ